MPSAFFVSDLHGRLDRYASLFRLIEAERPGGVFLGGDLFPHAMARSGGEVDFYEAVFRRGFGRLRDGLKDDYPRVFLILGNDDAASLVPEIERGAADGLWRHTHGRTFDWQGRVVLGYACVPPTPFGLKDWERYDVSRYVDPGCVSPEEGIRTVEVPAHQIRYGTIAADLEALAPGGDLAGAICLFHTPPHRTRLDRAGLDGRTIDHVPLEVHVGSIAVRRFIEARQPAVTLHGHIHESARLTGAWRDRLGRTEMFSAAHDGPELALVRFDPSVPQHASRELV